MGDKNTKQAPHLPLGDILQGVHALEEDMRQQGWQKGTDGVWRLPKVKENPT